MPRSSRSETTTTEELRDRRARRRIAYIDAGARVLAALYPYARALIVLEGLRDQAPHLLGSLPGS